MAGEAVYVMEWLEDRENWRVRRENGDTLPIEGSERDEVLGRARQYAREHAPSYLRIEDRKGLLEDELHFE